MKSGLFYRILFSLLLLFVLCTGFMAFILLNNAEKTIEAFRLEQARALTKTLADSSLDALAVNDYEGMDQLLQASVLGKEFAYAYLSRANGLIIADTDMDRVATRSAALGAIKKPLVRDITYRGKSVREVVYPAWLGNKHMANAHLGYYRDTRPFYSHQIAIRLITLIILTLAILSIVTTLILRRSLAPLETLARIMQQTRDYLPELSSKLLGQNDEIGLLARNFKDLMQRLANSYNQLFEEKEFHQVTLDSIADAVIVTDEKGDILYLNAVAEQLTGWNSDEVGRQPLKSIFNIIDASTRLPIDNPVDKVLATGEVIYLSNHTTLIARDQSEYQIADSASPIRDRNSNILGMVLVFNDVTEQYQLREATARSKKNLQAIMDHSPAVIYTKDTQGHYIFINRTFKQLFQLRDEEVIGKTDEDLFPAEFIEKYSYFNHQVNHQVLTTDRTMEVEEQTPVDGSTHYFLSVKFTLRDDDHHAYALCCIATDITERKKQAEMVRRSQKMNALGQLTGGIAHDYNNMLGIILGYAELLEKKLSEQPDLSRYVHQIYHAAERGSKLTRKLLAFTRQRNSATSIVNINTVLQEQKQVIEKTLTTRIKLTFDLDPVLWPVTLDDSDLEDAILNLCINAMHAMAPGGQLTIHTGNHHLTEADTRQTTLHPGDYVLLTVTDTGCGMDEETREQIFDPFYTTRGQRGTGLGLSQVYGFVQRSEGLIQVYSEPGQGSRFAIYFPRSQQPEKETETMPVIPRSKLCGTETILVVDDESDITSLIQMLLTEHGYRVFTAASGSQALQVLEKENIELIISDIIMPNMDGYQLAEIVQQRYPQIKIQLVSGFADDQHHDLVQDELHKNMMYKPCSSQELLIRVRHLLDQALSDCAENPGIQTPPPD